MKQIFRLFFGITLIISYQNVQAQVPTCGVDVPYFFVDLSGDPDAEWISPSHYREDNCCGTTSPDRCTSFEILLDTGAAMINFEIASGAIPPGSMFYQIDCGPPVAVGDPICISGVGPHYLTFCKPGNNENTYRVTSIPKPIFPKDDSTRIGCTLPLEILGLESITINSVFPGAIGEYNTYLSCTDCATPDFEPGLASPPFIDYVICGSPLASACGYVAVCDTVRVYAFDELDGSITPNPASFCSGGAGVTLTASGVGGDGSYSYNWLNSGGTSVGTGSTYNASTMETFTVVISDGLNSATCPSESFSVPVTIGNPPVVDAGLDQTVCATDPETFLDGSVTFATGIWSGGAGTFDPDNTTLFASYTPTTAEIAAGSVTLTLTSVGAGGGCPEDSDDIIISFSDTIDITLTPPTLLCNSSTGTLSSTVTGGTPALTYLWSTGESSTSITAGAGTYWLDVTDAIGCIQTESIVVTAPAALTVTMSSTDVTTDGGSDGTATVVVGGGTPPYSYLWSNGDMTATATGLSYGIATVTVTDANGCTITGSVVVNEPQCASFGVTASSTDVTCFGDSDGTGTAVASGGLAPYTYSWDTFPVTTTAVVTGLSAGTYTVTATDDNGCIDLATVAVLEPSQLTNNMTHTDATTIGGTDGSATSTPAGGTPGYTYVWTPGGATTATISSIGAGTYYVDVTDANLCTISDSVIVNEPPCNNFNVGIVSTNVTCNGDADGTATAIIAHGTAPYTIVWSDGQVGATATGLTAGSYTVTVTDASNCTTFETVSITEPSALSIGLTPTSISCFGYADGTIDLTVTGGTYPYEFEWSTGGQIIGQSEDLTNLSPGTYSITVTDDNGCVSTSSVGITQPAQLVATSTKVNVTCYGYTDGSIDATVTGGTSPYSYSWTGPSFSSSSLDISSLGAGYYALSVTDLNGCTLVADHEVYINQPDSVIIENITVSCPDPDGTTALVEVDSITGGDELGYQISYDGGTVYGTMGDYDEDLTIGTTYNVYAMDGNGCVSMDPYVLVLDQGIVIDSVVFDPCIPAGSTDIPVDVYVSGGDGGPYEVSSDNGSTFGAAGVTTLTLAVGSVYNIVARDGKGCETSANTINIPTELSLTLSITSEVSCLGESDGSIGLDISGGVSPYSFDWSGPASYTSTSEDISGLEEGLYTVIVTDDSSCTITDNITLTTVVDITNPTIDCPSDITVVNDAGLCGAIVSYLTPVGVDNCPLGTNTTMTAGLASGSFFPVGITIVTYEVADSVGNTASCSFNVTVNDNEDPLITCPADVAVNSDPGVCEATGVTLGSATTSDNCGVATVVNDAPATFPVGTTIVTWTVTDDNGNTASCTQNVVVTDIENPTITCPADVAVDSDPGVCEATGVTLGSATTSDNCGVATITNDAPAAFPVGTTVVTWTVTDDNGNTATCTQNVVVTDNEDPVISCPLDINVNTDLGVCGTDSANVSLGNPITSDNCGVASITNDAPALFPVGTTTVTWTVTDDNGNVATCTQDVVVTDNEDPAVTCPADVAVDTDLGVCGTDSANVALGSPTTSDNCGIASITNDAPALFPVGTTTVTWTVTDDNGNITTCTQDVVVTDNEDPAVTCPADVAVDTDLGVCGTDSANVALGLPTTSDNCGIASITNDAPALFPVGTTTVTWTVTDDNGNITTCTQDVVVTDSEDPAVTCPLDIDVNTDLGVCGTDSANVSLGNPITSDNCGIASITNDAPALFPVGTTTVTWTVTDNNGNVSTCTQDVVVTDNEDPTVTCAADLAVDTDLGVCGADSASVGLTAPTSSDNCGIASITNDAPALFPVGTTTVTWTVTDDNGNVTTCTQDVVVTDNEDPTIACATDIAIDTDLGICGADSASVGLTAPSASDNCGIATITNDAPALFPVGTTTVTWTVTDDNGNVSTCTQDVVVTDNELPTLTFCPSDTATCFPDVIYDLPTADDNCGVSTIVQTAGLGSGSSFPVGVTTETYEITDDNGNVQTCSFNITIHPTPVLTITGEDVTCFGLADGSIDLTADSATAPYSYLWNTTDTTEDLTGLEPGFYEVTVTDSNGCQAMTDYTIGEPDTIKVTDAYNDVSCYGFTDGNILITPIGGTPPYDYVWNTGDTIPNLDSIPAGLYELTLTDSNGCLFLFSIDITEPDSMYASSTTVNATCESANGFLDLTVYGGTEPYSYTWSDSVSTTQDLDSVKYGTYEVTIVDTNGCILVYSDSIGFTNPMSINANYEDPLCYGDSTGFIGVEVLNADDPVYYIWSTGDTTDTLMNIPAGEYTLTVTDSNLCELTRVYTLDQPDSLWLSTEKSEYLGGYNVSGYGLEDGWLDLTVSGGVLPYQFLWSTGDEYEDLDFLPAGIYSVLVTDENGCTVQLSDTLTQPFMLEMPTGFSPNDDGHNDFFVVQGLDVFPDNEIQIYNRWGNKVYTTSGYQNDWDGRNNNGKLLPDGTYFVILTIPELDEPLTGYVDMRRSR